MLLVYWLFLISGKLVYLFCFVLSYLCSRKRFSKCSVVEITEGSTGNNCILNILNSLPLWHRQCYSLSQNGWDTLGSPCPLNVGVQDLVTKPR